MIVVSDTHLSPAAPQAQANWEAALRYISSVNPDLVLHLGDLSLDGAHDASDLHYGRAQLDRLPVPWHAVPGNHDVGDNPLTGAPAGYAIDAGRQQRWNEVIGADHWSLSAGGWTLLAVNAQLFGSGLAAEYRQWEWLEEQAGRCGSDQPIALVTHKPIAAPGPELEQSPAFRFVPQPAREHLARLFLGKTLALVLSGHVHQYRQLRLDDVEHLWVPTTWAFLPDHLQPVLGMKRSGLVALEFADGAAPQPVLVEPDGLAQLTLIEDLPDPYRRERT